MTKTQKIDYILETSEFFTDAKNHGGRGNWWYPTPNTVAYNVKMYGWGDIEAEARAKMSVIQAEYYKDITNLLNNYYDQTITDACYDLHDDIVGLGKFDVKEINFAGRSGGWCEVTYNTGDVNEYDRDELEAMTAKEVTELYAEAKHMQDIEIQISEYIKNAHKRLNDFVKGSVGYIDGFVSFYLKSDSEILDELDQEAKWASEKLKKYQSLTVTA